jgi:Tfp pilus assembly protein PilF
MGENCIACHMPRNPVADVEHAVYTDHSIPRRPDASARGTAATRRNLIPFGNTRASDRDLGLAYASIEASQPNSYRTRAFELLKNAAAQHPDDTPVLAQLAHLHDVRSEETEAMRLYQEVLRADPSQAPAAVNYGAILVKRGRSEEAMWLWSDALSRNPGLEAARINLATAQLRAGDVKSAQATLVKALELNPGFTVARRLLNQLRNPIPRGQ